MWPGGEGFDGYRALPVSHFRCFTSGVSLLVSRFRCLTSGFSLPVSHFRFLTSGFSLPVSAPAQAAQLPGRHGADAAALLHVRRPQNEHPQAEAQRPRAAAPPVQRSQVSEPAHRGAPYPAGAAPSSDGETKFAGGGNKVGTGDIWPRLPVRHYYSYHWVLRPKGTSYNEVLTIEKPSADVKRCW